VIRLAQTAFRDIPQVNRERYTYDAFVQSINDLGLHHQLLARGVTTVEDALAEGEAYFLANHLHRNRVTFRQVDMEPPTALTASNAENPAVAKVTQMTVASKVAQMTDMLAELVSTLAPLSQLDTASELDGPPVQSPGRGHPPLLGVWTTRTLPETLSPTSPRVKLRRPADTLTSGGPPINSQGRTQWRPPHRTPVRDLAERPPGRQVGCTSHSSPVFSMPPRNRFDKRRTAESAERKAQAPRGVTPPSRQLVSSRRQKPSPFTMAREMRSPEIPLHPHESTLFLPGKIASKPAQFLLDTGCTTNLLSCRFFDTLSAQIRNRLEPYKGDHGTLADGSWITFYGIIELPGSFHDRTIQETFLVGQLQEDAILGMPFLQRHSCRIDFGISAILMGDQMLSCVDKFGRPLTGEEPIVRTCTMTGHSRGTVRRKVDGGHTFQDRSCRERTHERSTCLQL